MEQKQLPTIDEIIALIDEKLTDEQKHLLINPPGDGSQMMVVFDLMEWLEKNVIKKHNLHIEDYYTPKGFWEKLFGLGGGGCGPNPLTFFLLDKYEEYLKDKQ